jgi:hypothetical protein
MNKEDNMEREMDDSFLDKRFKENPFLVPDNYFHNLEEQILAISKLHAKETAESFKTPEGYFEDMNARILSQIAISGTSTQNNFEVPDLYFENLSTTILEHTKKSGTAKVIKFSVVKYAAAAVLLIATTLGAYLYQTNNKNVTDKLANIPEQEIVDYLKFYTDPNDVSFIIESTDDFSFLEDNIDRQIVN